MDCANTQPSEASVNHPMPHRMTRRRPKASEMAPCQSVISANGTM